MVNEFPFELKHTLDPKKIILSLSWTSTSVFLIKLYTCNVILVVKMANTVLLRQM